MQQCQKEQLKKQSVIGVILSGVRAGYEYHIYTGIRDAALEHNVTVIYYPIKPIGLEVNTRTNHPDINNFIVEHLFDPERLDGIIVLAEVFQVFYTKEAIDSFYSLFASTPLVDIGVTGTQRTTIDANHYDGMLQLLAHLIETHGYRRIAYIRGLDGVHSSEQRFQAYQDAMGHYGLDYDDRWVADGDFKSSSGVQAVKQFYDEHQLNPDVIVASNDEIALGTLWALQRQGLRVPEDVALTGFDDMAEAQIYRPSLTSVQQPTYRMGYLAVETLIAQLAGANPIDRIQLPTQLMVRESCGALATKNAPPLALSDADFQTACHQVWQQKLGSVLTNISPYLDDEKVLDLADKFIYDVQNEGGTDRKSVV